MASISATLCFTGVLLFLVGLLVGFGIPLLASPRLGLSAHVTGVQSGVTLVAVGLLWPHLNFREGWSEPTAYVLWVSLYVISIGQILGAIWATGRSLPIAGGGTPAQPWQERLVRTLLTVGSFATTAAIVTILVQWRWT
jgi:hydroxylaminobenzene mutase